MVWKMELCLGRNQDLREKTFESWEDAVDWLRRNQPRLLRDNVWKTLDGENFRQFGTGYYWAAFSRVSR